MEPPSSDSVLVGRIRLDTTIRGAFERPEVALAFEGRGCGPVWPCPWGWWRLWNGISGYRPGSTGLVSVTLDHAHR
jgi:hypothetical protein